MGGGSVWRMDSRQYDWRGNQEELMRTRTKGKVHAAKAVKKGFRMIGVLDIDDRMRQLDKCYARLQFSGASRVGKVVPVVALTGEVNLWR